MANVIIYLIATIGAAVQVYGGVTHNLWWAPNDPFPAVGLIGVLFMTLGTAWGAVKGTSAAWIVFVGTLFCWAFYIPGLGNLIGSLSESMMAGRTSFTALNTYLPLLPPVLLLVATYTSVVAGPMRKTDS